MPQPSHAVRAVTVALSLGCVAVALAQAPTAQPAAEPKGAAETARRAQVVARFEGGAVTLGELEDSIVHQSPFMRKRYADVSARKDLLDRLVRFELLAAEAERRGYARHPDVVEALKQTTIQALMKEAIEDEVDEASVPPEDVKRYYEKNRAEFVRPASRRAAHVLLATEDEAKALLAKARDADLRAFREIARHESADEVSKARGGDVGYFDDKGVVSGEDTSSVPPAIVKAVFALENVGDVAPAPVAIEGGYSVVKLTGNRPASERSLASADATIRARLARDRRREATDAFVEKLKAEHTPVVKAELLELVK